MERPKPATMARDPLSKERVLHTAVQLADRWGLEALTMRKLADELGVGVMSLYYYVPNKDKLIEGMVELVFSEIQLPPNDVDWKAAMRLRAVSTREALNRHRWAVGLMESNPLPGPQSFRVHDAVLGCLRDAGFSIEMTIQAYSVLDSYIYGFALQEKTVPFEDAAGSAAVVEEQVREFDELAAPHAVGRGRGGLFVQGGFPAAPFRQDHPGAHRPRRQPEVGHRARARSPR